MTTQDRRTSTTSASPADHGHIQQYEIRVEGQLGSRWTPWFDGLSITDGEGGTTLISGPAVDQAALHGVLQKLRDLGIPLVSLTQLPPDPPLAPPAHPTTKGS